MPAEPWTPTRNSSCAAAIITSYGRALSKTYRPCHRPIFAPLDQRDRLPHKMRGSPLDGALLLWLCQGAGTYPEPYCRPSQLQRELWMSFLFRRHWCYMNWTLSCKISSHCVIHPYHFGVSLIGRIEKRVGWTRLGWIRPWFPAHGQSGSPGCGIARTPSNLAVQPLTYATLLFFPKLYRPDVETPYSWLSS